MNAVQEFISITPWTAVFSVCNLLILFLLVRRFLFEPVTAVLTARQREIDELYGEADRERSSANALRAQYERRLSDAREEADGIVRRAMESAQHRSEQIVGEANAQAVRIRQRAEGEIEQERRKAFDELQGEISGLAVDIAERLIARSIDEDGHRALVDAFIRDAGGIR